MTLIIQGGTSGFVNDPHKLKRKLKQNGWTYRKAAHALGVTYQYFCDIVNGNRESIRLVKRIRNIASMRAEYCK